VANFAGPNWSKSGEFQFLFLLEIWQLCAIFPEKIPVKDSQPPFFRASNCPKTKHCN
jgi:hypothetical protein